MASVGVTIRSGYGHLLEWKRRSERPLRTRPRYAGIHARSESSVDAGEAFDCSDVPVL
ncbi:hypothetical protein [Kitasatospora sp. NPDC017646]|uniref:hypothetical protein n=1 Tax=Kitasatospora sp. NPDC017646 TaxID=3364024 RepID=UPI0037AF30CF